MKTYNEIKAKIKELANDASKDNYTEIKECVDKINSFEQHIFECMRGILPKYEIMSNGNKILVNENNNK